MYICRKYPREKPEKLERIDVKGLSIIKHMAQSEKARAVEHVSTSLFQYLQLSIIFTVILIIDFAIAGTGISYKYRLRK